MTEGQHSAILVARYEHTRAQVRANQAVDVAEDILGHAWVDQLAALRRRVSDQVRASCDTAQAAWKLLQHAEGSGDAREIATARRMLGRARTNLTEDLAAARLELAEIDGQLRRVHQAALDRLHRRHEDFDRLQAAHTAAFGTARA
ncbi:hypothetical protein [Actinospica robiniae]|uniref:hypothetical protein n=1 Tax=Actinospica robiniae TaxID=304901 RepID=UPI0012F87D5F|nr:hypothetical protein [Actinospica robiniae]